MRIKLFENFNEDTKIKQDINDMLVELGDDNKFKWEIDLEANSLRVGFTRYWDEEDVDRDEYEPDGFFMLREIVEYVYMVVDYMKEKFPDVSFYYSATDPAGDNVHVGELNNKVIDKIDSKLTNIGNSHDDVCPGLVYFGINFSW